MKRKIMDIQSKGSEIRSCIEELSVIVEVIRVASLQAHHENGDNDAMFVSHHEADHAHVPTRPFLSLCHFLVQVLDKIGPTMTVLRQDIHQNIRVYKFSADKDELAYQHFSLNHYNVHLYESLEIKRLEMRHEDDPSTYSNMVEILKTEATDGISRNLTSCSRAFVWLTRSLDFAAELLQSLAEKPGKNMKEAVEESYNLTLKPWHRWISSAASKVALMLVPDNETFISSLMTKDESYDNLRVEMETLVSLLVPFLQQIHSILRFYQLDKLKAN